MEHLNKQQIVLLTLFTSFVTSIATGIVTVALVDQAPAGVTNTIQRVIEETVEPTASSDSSSSNQSADVSNAVSALLSGANQIPNATAIAQKSLVRITTASGVTGFGVVVSNSGIIMSDKSTVSTPGDYYAAVMPDGSQYPLQILQAQNNGDIVFLLAQMPQPTASSTVTATSSGEFIPAVFANLSGTNAPRLGETVIALSGNDSTSVAEGIISKIDQIGTSTIASFGTSIDPTQVTIGSPLFDAAGDFLGIKTAGTGFAAFYPVGYLKSVIPAL